MLETNEINILRCTNEMINSDLESILEHQKETMYEKEFWVNRSNMQSLYCEAEVDGAVQHE